MSAPDLSPELSLPRSRNTIESIIDVYSDPTLDNSGGSSESKTFGSGSAFGSHGAKRTPLVAKRSQYRTPLSVSGEGSSLSTKSSSRSSQKRQTRRNLSLELDIKLRLLPIAHLLTKAGQNEEIQREARYLAHTALEDAKRNGANRALIGRCCFYVASSHWDPSDTTATEDAMLWFQRATDASLAGYPEGQWAQEWLNYWESQKMSSRPGSSGSWLGDAVGNMWSFLRSYGSTSASRPKQRKVPDDEEAISPKTRGKPGLDYQQRRATLKSDATRDHYGVLWSERRPFGKGEIIKGIQHELVESPTQMSDIAGDFGEEWHIPNNVLGGLVEVGNLSPVMQRSPTRASRSSMQYTPASAMHFGASHTTPRVLRIVNGSEPLPSPSSKPLSPNQTKYFPEPSTTHLRNKSVTFATGAETPMQAMERSASERRTSSEPVGGARHRRKASLTNLNIVAPALDALNFLPHRRRSELFSQMEQGESPLRPKPHEEMFYKRRNSDIIEEV